MVILCLGQYGANVEDDCIFQKLDEIERMLAVVTTKAKKQARITDYFTPMQYNHTVRHICT